LDRGRPGFPRGYSCPAVLTHPYQGGGARPATGLSPAPARLPRRFASGATCSLLEAAATASVRAVQPPPRIGSPATERGRFGLLRVRSPLLAESRSISVPRGTEMFQFPRYPPPSRAVPVYDHGGVAPFGNSRIIACWQLPETFRRLQRPSSAPSAKASTVCLYSLVLHKVGNTEVLLLLLRL
jgi:hypothetical protein